MNWHDLLKPTYIKELAQKYDLTPSKQFGQNYLTHEKTINLMIESAQIGSNDIVVEIGPGLGAITIPLSKMADVVWAFEIEKILQAYWEDRQKEYKNIKMIWGNAVNKFPEIVSSLPKKYKVVANLPYQVASHIIRILLESEKPPETIVVMVQKEVAERMTAGIGDMSVLSVAVQYFGDVKIVTKVPRTHFWPQPNVDSAVVSIKNIKKRPNKEKFFSVVKAGFKSRRKTLANNLQKGLEIEKSITETALSKIGKQGNARAETLTIADWEQLVTILST